MLTQSIRGLMSRPWLTLVIVATLACGIGANAAVFSVVDALLLRPLPYPDAGRLVRIGSVLGGEDGAVTWPELREVGSLHDVIADVAAYTDQGQYNASGDGPPEELAATITTHNLFSVLGITPALGGTWPASYDRTRHFSVVISDRLWARRFGRDPNVRARTMTLDGAEGYEIVGVAPPNVDFPSRSDLFRSSGINPDPASYESRDRRYLSLVARLQPGVSSARAQEALDRLAARLEREFPASNTGIRFHATPLRDLYVGNVRPYLLLLLGAVAFVLLLACANVANLLLAKAVGRQRDLAVRSALGASRGTLVRQLLTESALLAAAGAIAGVGVAAVAIRLLTTVVDLRLPTWMRIGLDWRVLTVLAAAAAVTALAAGLLPALRLSRPDLTADLKESSRGSSGGAGQQRLRQALVVGEVAIAALLLVGAGLMLQTVRQLQRVNLGFVPDHLLTFRVELGWRAYDTLAKSVNFYTATLDGLRRRGDVESVALDSNLPLSGKPRDPNQIVIEGQAADQYARNPFVNAHWISPGLFSTLRVPLAAGRTFTDDDRAGSLPVAIVNRRFAERFFGAASPIGRRIRYASSQDWKTIVGVVENVRHQDVTLGPGFDVYSPYQHTNVGGMYVLVRTRGDPGRLSSSLAAIVWGIDPNQSFFDVQPLESRVATILWHQRAAGWLFGAFALLALTLAASGLYAVLSYAVTQRTRELAVRIALGAASRDVIAMVLSHTMMLVAAGLAIGLLSAAVLSSTIERLLFGIRALDPWTFAGVAGILAVVAAFAAYLPVRRATRVDPLTALRSE